MSMCMSISVRTDVLVTVMRVIMRTMMRRGMMRGRMPAETAREMPSRHGRVREHGNQCDQGARADSEHA